MQKLYNVQTIRTNKRTSCMLFVETSVTHSKSDKYILFSPNTGSDEIYIPYSENYTPYKRGDKLPERVAEHWRGFLSNQK